jgi:uncharacterized protein (TIGR03435 family)
MRGALLGAVALVFGICVAAAPNAKFLTVTLAPVYTPPQDACIDSVMHGGPGTNDPRTLTFNAVKPVDLLALAFGVEPYQILGLDRTGRDWNGTTLYRITAKLPDGTTKSEIGPMFQQMLADRFDLDAHRETTDRQFYELVSAENGVKMRYASLATRTTHSPLVPRWGCLAAIARNGRVRIDARSVGVPELTRNLMDLLGRPVLDKTGVSGKYDFNFEYPVEGLAGPLGMAELTRATRTGALGLNTALQEQLGLSLKEKTDSFDGVVIDRIDEVPAKLSKIVYCVLPTWPALAAQYPEVPRSSKITAPKESSH